MHGLGTIPGRSLVLFQAVVNMDEPLGDLAGGEKA